MWSAPVLLSAVSLCGTVLAAPAPSPIPTAPASLDDRDLISDLLGDVGDVLGDVVSDLDVVFSKVGAGSLTGDAAWSAVKTVLASVSPTKTQTDAAACMSTMSAIHAAAPSANLYQFIASLVAEGLTTDSVTDALDFISGVLDGENSMSNVYVSLEPDDMYNHVLISF